MTPTMVEIRRDFAAGVASVEALSARREVQLWMVPLRAESSKQDENWRILSADEKSRAERFRFARDRERYVMARGRLRILLGEYLSQGPQDVVFAYGPQGKPALAGDHALQFNLAHSGDLALYAFCAGAQVGVDVEQIRPLSDQDALAQRFFSAEECRDLTGLPQAERKRAFFACWTRKEAYVKALGSGLSLPLASFRVSLLPKAAPELLFSDPSGQWTMFDVTPAFGYRGAVVIEGLGWTLSAKAEESSEN